jgi:hypothetical protein
MEESVLLYSKIFASNILYFLSIDVTVRKLETAKYVTSAHQETTGLNISGLQI